MDAPAARETILVVDDEIGTRYSIARVLTKEGYVVLEGGTGREALELAPKAALVILDIRLPDLSGIEVNRRLKENAATRFLPVLHLSATFTSPQDRAAGLEGGADAYLVHPFDAGELLATVRALLRASKMRGESHRAARQWRNA
ncbi:MAG TPA: response regulator transcription factor, partial [Planctomycetota bacterium]|nr:response regulator transcription factor [Planctomycetota bacterium]